MARRLDRTYPLQATSLMVRGQFYPLDTQVEPVERARANGTTYRPGAGVVVMPGTLVLFSLFMFGLAFVVVLIFMIVYYRFPGLLAAHRWAEDKHGRSPFSVHSVEFRRLPRRMRSI